MKQTDARIRAFVTDVLKKSKSLTEREVKAAIGRAFKLNPNTISAGVIRSVRKKLGIDRPGAISHAKKLLAKNPTLEAKNPTLEAKKVIAEVGGKFGIKLQPPDVSRLRPAGAKRQRAARGKGQTKVKAQAAPTGRGKRAAGAISVTYEGKGAPEDLAMFFRSLAE